MFKKMAYNIALACVIIFATKKLLELPNVLIFIIGNSSYPFAFILTSTIAYCIYPFCFAGGNFLTWRYLKRGRKAEAFAAQLLPIGALMCPFLLALGFLVASMFNSSWSIYYDPAFNLLITGLLSL